jgi:hypothetical protein
MLATQDRGMENAYPVDEDDPADGGEPWYAPVILWTITAAILIAILVFALRSRLA